MKKIKKELSHTKRIKIKLSRVVIYSLLAFVGLAAFFVVYHNYRNAQKVAVAQQLQQHLDDTATAFKKLQGKKDDYQAQGVDTSVVEGKINQIYDDIFKNRDYQTADSQIKDMFVQLDNMLAELNAKKLAAEQLKGDLSGTITCGGATCRKDVSVKLLSGDATAASSQADQSGNYSFHQDAGSYNLSASLSGYKAIYKSSVDIISQKKTNIDLNLEKISVKAITSETSDVSSANSSASPSTNFSADSSATAANSSDSGPISTELNLINDYRASNGLSRLSLDPSISTAATGHSSWMSSTGNFSHYGENGSAPWDRCAAAQTSCKGEILFMGSTDPAVAFDGWKNSPPHNAIMLGNNYSAIGIGIVGVYWSADFR